MPYVNIKITREGGPDGTSPSPEQKAQLVAGVTDLLRRVLNKNPQTTFVVIDEVALIDWGIASRSVQDLRAGQT